MTPYYADDFVTLYHGDNREISWGLGRFGLLLTDPPYGISADRRQSNRAGKQHGRAVAASRDYGASDWDSAPPESWVLPMLVSRAERSIIWGGNHFDLPASKAWLVWDKQNGDNGYADAEMAWTNLDQSLRLFRHRWMGMLQGRSDDGDHRVHPTQKPVPLMRWCLAFAPEGTVFDPFAGSGTTLRAAKDDGRISVGIEREERYCEIIARRMSQEVLGLGDVA